MAVQLGASSGDAVASDVLSGVTFSNATAQDVAGTMANQGAANLTPSGTSPVTIPAGYHNGSGVVAQVTVPAADVLTGTTIAGVAGTMPNQGSPTFTPSSSSQTIPAGYYGGGTIAAIPLETPGISYSSTTGTFTFGFSRPVGALFLGWYDTEFDNTVAITAWYWSPYNDATVYFCDNGPITAAVTLSGLGTATLTLSGLSNTAFPTVAYGV